MSREDPQFKLRMPPELKARIEQAAKESRRSLNAEIVARLEETLAIEKALEDVAPGSPVTGTAGLLLDMHNQLGEREADAHGSAMAVHAEKIETHIRTTDARIGIIEQQLQQLIGLLTKE